MKEQQYILQLKGSKTYIKMVGKEIQYTDSTHYATAFSWFETVAIMARNQHLGLIKKEIL